MEFRVHRLANGLRLVHIDTHGEVAHFGVLIGTGSRHESDHEHGLAHFIEHMYFKGTAKRRSYHILSRLEDRGGELNAYTTKEDIALYSSFLREDYPVAVELLSDLLLNSTFPQREIPKEAEVVTEEINSYNDSPSELIYDEFEEMIYPGQPLGRSILGSPGSVKSFNTGMIKDFISRNYSNSRIILCSAGNIRFNRLVKMVENFFSHTAFLGDEEECKQSPVYKPSKESRKKDTWQTHCIIGNRAFDLKDEKRTGMYLLNNILGGIGLNSRLNMSLREKRGLAYNVESVYNPYCDTGVFSIYFGTDKHNIEKSMDVAGREMKKLRDTGLGTLQLHRAKQQIKGLLARSYESHESLMLSIGKSLLVYDLIDTPEEIFNNIEKISSEDLTSIANEVFDPGSLSTLIYK